MSFQVGCYKLTTDGCHSEAQIRDVEITFEFQVSTDVTIQVLVCFMLK